MKWLWLLLLVPLLLGAGALLLNRAPLFEPPGFCQRLLFYLTTHVAETRPGDPRAELRPLRVALSRDQAVRKVTCAMADLGWDEIQISPQGVSAVVTSALFGFKDDVQVSLSESADGVIINVRAESRLGQGDFAANTRHVRRLFKVLRDTREP